MSDEDPLEAVADGTLRHDLYYRVARIVLLLPPLRERLEDIPAAVVWMGNRLLRDHGVPGEVRLPEDPMVGARDVRLTVEAIAALKQHSWDGNFRELEAVLERAIMLYRDENGALTGEVMGQALLSPATSSELHRPRSGSA
jgi:transcriptional regulator with PAS, ATPase and Fis domain